MSAPSTQSPPSASPRWLFGPAVDLLLGCGLIYSAIVALLFLWQPKLTQINPWLPLVILLTGVPHYGATLLRVRGTPEDRRRYIAPLVVLTSAVVAAFIAGLSFPRFGALLITLYLTLSPWHYAAQNFGVTMLFLRRRDVPIDIPIRRLLRASFVTSFLLVLLSYHQAGAGGGYDPLYAASSTFRFIPLGIPRRVIQIATPFLFLIHVVTLGMALRLLFRRSNWRALTPALALLFSQGVWFSIPALVRIFAPGRYPGNYVALAFVWIALGHCVQYLWISTYFHRAAKTGHNASPQPGRGVRTSPWYRACYRAWYMAWYLVRVTLIGAALWVIPAVLFAPGALGHVPFDYGLGLLIAAAVNLHHFALDALIWRLREPRVRALLVRGHASAADIPTSRRARSGPPTLATCTLITLGGLSIFIWLQAAWEREVGHRRAFAAKDLPRLAQASERLAAMGRDGPQIHIALGKLNEQQGRKDEALAEFGRSLRIKPTAAAFRGLARVHKARGELADAESAERAAQGLEVDGAAAH